MGLDGDLGIVEQAHQGLNALVARLRIARLIALPSLPYHQEHGYDPKQHKLIIIEYPDRQAAVQAQEDA